jgi:hypothetical protein
MSRLTNVTKHSPVTLTNAKESRKLALVNPDPDLAKWCAALASPIAPDEVPPNWHTARELCKKLGKSESRMNELLRRAIEAGKCERQEFRIPAAGTVRPVPHYRLK